MKTKPLLAALAVAAASVSGYWYYSPYMAFKDIRHNGFATLGSMLGMVVVNQMVEAFLVWPLRGCMNQGYWPAEGLLRL